MSMELVKARRAKIGSMNRANGEAFERKILGYELRNSVFAMRSSGSYGPVDVMSQKKNGEVWYISAKKNGYFHCKELATLRKIKDSVIKHNPMVRFKLAYYTSPKVWKYENLK